jgi:hypothetical protein
MNPFVYLYNLTRTLKVLLINPYEDRERQLLVSTIKNFYNLKYQKIMEKYEK